MIGVLRSEWVKFRSVRSNLILVVAGGLLVVAFAFGGVHDVKNRLDAGDCEREVVTADGGTVTDVRRCAAVDPAEGWKPVEANLGDLTIGIPVALFLFGALGVQIIGQEYRFNTIRPTFTAVPRRGRVLAAKLAVATGTIAVISVLMLALCAVVGTVMLSSFTIDGVDARLAWGTVLFSIGWTMLGMGIGSIIRQPVAAILVLLAEAFVLESILSQFWSASIRWLPFVNGIQMTVRDPADSTDYRSVLGGGIYFFVVAIAVWAIGALLVQRRDA